MGRESQSAWTGSSRRDSYRLLIRPLTWVVLVVLALSAAESVRAQTPITFRYFYDDTGQLSKVVDSTGILVEYVYDPVGNILEVKRSKTAGGLTLFNFTPGQGGPLTAVSIQGQGFAATPAANVVRFNGVVAAVLSATTDTLIASVPVGATSGPISVTVLENTATSAASFVTVAVPVITSITPNAIDVTLPPSSIRITGANLGGATFGFLPVLQPSPLTIGTPQVNTDGTAATLPITVLPSARGRFTLVGTNAFGGSDAMPSKGNTVTVITAQDEVDSDGDGFPDRLEALLGSDPFDPESVPNPNAIRVGEVEAQAVSVLNTGGLAPGQVTTLEADAIVFSTLNLAGVTGGQPLQLEANALAFSTLNTGSSVPAGAASGSGGTGVDGGGQGGFGGRPVLFEADAIPFTVNNVAPGAPPAAIQGALSPRPESPVNRSQGADAVAASLKSHPLAFINAYLTAGSQTTESRR